MCEISILLEKEDSHAGRAIRYSSEMMRSADTFARSIRRNRDECWPDFFAPLKIGEIFGNLRVRVISTKTPNWKVGFIF